MATTIRYVPREYMDTERALIRIAAVRKPDRWCLDNMHPKEREIYEGLGRIYNAQYLADHLRVQIPADERKANPEILERVLDYNDAIYALREALHAGDFVAEFVDEHGKFDFIKPEGWGGEAGLEILCCGVAWLDYGPLTASRLVLFKKETIETFAAKSISADAENRAPLPRVIQADIEKHFNEWRNSRGQNIPSEAEDYNHMRQFGVSRERVRSLRQKAPRKTRGRPKQ